MTGTIPRPPRGDVAPDGGGATAGASSPAARELPDQEARDAIRTRLDETLFVEAAAGTGKTTALVERIVEVLRRGEGTLEDIVAVTFTEKAAGEMKLRLRAEIEKARAAPDTTAGERANLELALEQLELAHIGTIHGFCADLLRERPIEAGVDPSFQVAAEDEAGRLLDTAFQDWFEGVLSDPPPGVRRALRRGYPRDSGGPRGALRGAAGRLIEHRDFEAAWTRPDFDRRAALDRGVDLLRELAGLAPLARKRDDYLTRHFEILARRVRELDLHEEVHGRDYDGLEARLRRILRSRYTRWNWRGYNDEWFAEGLRKSDVLARRDAAKEELEQILATADADLAALLREELRPVPVAYEELKRREGRLDFVDLLLRTRNLLVANAVIRAHYQRRFTHFFVDEFQDTDPLQAEILLLLSADDPGETAFDRVRPVPGKLFLVGDPKQSIYRFRRADVMLYERTKRRLQEAGARILRLTTSFRSQPRIQAAVNGAFARRMTGSEDGSQADYVPLSGYREDRPAQPAVIALPVPRPYGRYGSVWKNAVEASLPDAVGALVDWIVNESGWTVTERENPGGAVAVEPRHVCLLFRRFQTWGDDVTRPYVRALEAREIPHVLVGGRSYYDREEVLAVRNALTAIEWPDDTLSVYGALRGPLFSLGDGPLLAFSAGVARDPHEGGHAGGAALHPLRPFGRYGELSGRTDAELASSAEAALEAMRSDGVEPALVAISDALSILGRLHRARNRRPIPETILRLLGAVRAHAGIAIWPTGEQALANVLRLVDRGRAFERTGSPSFRAFLDRLEEEAESGQAEEAPIVEEGTEGVRMMTVHKAKGLEFPVVILADITCNATFETPSRHVDAAEGVWAEALCGAAPLELLDHLDVELRRERAESDRIAYVAATRARDLLVVPALGDGRDGAGGFPEDDGEWWLDALTPSLYPAAGERRDPGDASRFGCPPFERESVLERLDRDGQPKPTPRDSVAPGVHISEAGTEIVWWDPAALALDVDAPTGERQQRLLDVDEDVQPTLSVEEGIAAYEAWRARRAERLAAGAEPGHRVTAVKALARLDAEGAAEAGEAAADSLRPHPVPPGRPDVEWVVVPRPQGETRPGGDRFGALVHAALAVAPFDGAEATERAADAVAAYARALGATAEEAASATSLVARALAHPVLERAAAVPALSVRREVPLFVPEPDGTIVEGVADLAFREIVDGNPRWTVVDYKTDRSTERSRPLYEAQVARYAAAIEAATGEPAMGIVLSL